MATAPRPGAGRRAEAEEEVVRFKLKGEDYVLWPDDISAEMSNKLRRSAGFGVVKLLAAAEEDMDLDTVAALVFVARLQAGDNVSFSRVAQGITVADLESFEVIEDGTSEADEADEKAAETPGG